MPDPKNRKTEELPKKVDTRYADNLKMVLEKHRKTKQSACSRR